jgi:hypothetical protein
MAQGAGLMEDVQADEDIDGGDDPLAPALDGIGDVVVGDRPLSGQAPDGDTGGEHHDGDGGGAGADGGEDRGVGGEVVAAVGDGDRDDAGQPMGCDGGDLAAGAVGADRADQLADAKAQWQQAEQPYPALRRRPAPCVSMGANGWERTCAPIAAKSWPLRSGTGL